MVATTRTDGWVLYRAARDLGPWMRRSSAAQGLLVAGCFAVLLQLLLGLVLRDTLPPGAAQAAALVLAGTAGLAMVPLAALAWVHAGRRVRGVEVDPAGLTLHTAKGPVRARLEDLAEVRVGAEPSMARPEVPILHGPLRDLPRFDAILDLRLRNGQRWEFAGRSDEVAGVLAWLDVLGARHAIMAPPSSWAARTAAVRAIRRAMLLMVGAVALLAANTAFLLANRTSAMPLSELFATTVVGVALALALYAAAYRSSAAAGRAWLAWRGLGGSGPPLGDAGSAPAPAAEALAAPAQPAR